MLRTVEFTHQATSPAAEIDNQFIDRKWKRPADLRGRDATASFPPESHYAEACALLDEFACRCLPRPVAQPTPHPPPPGQVEGLGIRTQAHDYRQWPPCAGITFPIRLQRRLPVLPAILARIYVAKYSRPQSQDPRECPLERPAGMGKNSSSRICSSVHGGSGGNSP